MMNEAIAQFIVSRIIEYANDAINEEKNNKGDAFYKGRKLAYYEILDTIKSELDAHDEPLSEYGLNINLEKVFYAN